MKGDLACERGMSKSCREPASSRVIETQTRRSANRQEDFLCDGNGETVRTGADLARAEYQP